MAKFSPSISEILNDKENINAGKVLIISKLMELDDTYEVFVNPYVNGDDIDIIVLKRGCGAQIIQVYMASDLERINKDLSKAVKIVEKRAKNYKDNLYNLHIESLKNQNIYNSKVYSCINIAIYVFDDNIFSVFRQNKCDTFIELWGARTNIKWKLKNKLKANYLFNSDIYAEMKNLFEGKFKIDNKIKKIIWTDKQSELIKSESKHSKICGVAGSGKTLVLAKRAVNAAIRTKDKVVIITYNIALRKYIEDKIGAFSGALSKKDFKVIHFHEFINQELNNNHIQYKASVEELDGDLVHIKFILEQHRHLIKRYKSIFIDEVQDFRYGWLDIIKTYFLDEQDGEYVLFGDEKQNVYNRSLDENKKSKTNIRGAWNKLDKSFRFNSEINELGLRFQTYFFNEKYEIEELNNITKYCDTNNLRINQSTDNIRYLYRPDWNEIDIYNYIEQYLRDKNIDPKDTCVLCSKIELLRKLEFMMRNEYWTICERVFETKEQFDKICQIKNDYKKRKIELHRLRRIRRFNFDINSGSIKLCTVQSFKGWESNTLFIILDEEDQESNDEILYTALTRCKFNLVVININSLKYDEFFKLYLKDEEEYTYDYEDYDYGYYEESNCGTIFCPATGEYHSAEDIWMYDGSMD